MNKTTILILTILISPIIAALFGVIHNQFTYSISHEFFTKFMFERFGFDEYGHDTPRLTASIIGAWSTWWFGLIFGFIFAAVAYSQPTLKLMVESIYKATFATLCTTLCVGLIGLLYGWSGISGFSAPCCPPLEINNPESFAAVSEMHNFSYMGGIFGIVIGVIYQIRSKRAVMQRGL
jgi:hypothetical protein